MFYLFNIYKKNLAKLETLYFVIKKNINNNNNKINIK